MSLSKPNSQAFPVGARVKWTSSSNGVMTTKEGVITYSGAPISKKEAFATLPGASFSRLLFDQSSAFTEVESSLTSTLLSSRNS